MGKGGDAGKGEILIAPKTVPVVPITASNDNDSDKNNVDATTTGADDTNSGNTNNNGSNNSRPWYVRGGMHVNEVGMGLNVTVPAIFLAYTAASTCLHATYTPVQIFAALFLIQVLFAALEGMRTIFCVIAVPCYLTSLLVIPGTLQLQQLVSTSNVSIVTAATTMGLTILILTILRLGICMSVCLHRYAAHAAFKCSPVTRFFLNILGCMSHQGGPIWWASQHRCHHKHCDMPRDPHSAKQDGVEKAFAFFSTGHDKVDEEFAPRHNDTWVLRLLDTWSFVVCTGEMFMAYQLFGREGLFISYTSMWICQTTVLWFNIANHPPEAHPSKVCQATNYRGKPTGWVYPTFWLLDALYPLFGTIISEKNHEDHHVHFMLAKRERFDCMYYVFVWPLEMVGLVWDVKAALPE